MNITSSKFQFLKRKNMVVSPSIGLLIAGVASGIFIFISLRAKKNSKSTKTKREAVDDGRCACCLAPFLISRGVRCNDCGAKSCRKSCSRWNTSDNAWHCIFCHQRRVWIKRNEKWFDNFGGTTNEKEELHSFFGTAKSRVYVAGHGVATNMEIQEEQEEKRMVHIIRHFIEKIIEGLIDNVDDTSIDRLYENSEYDKFLEEHRPPLITALTRLATCLETSLMNKPSMDSPATAHAALREIVERAVEEARKLPGLGASADTEHPREGRPIADHSYEDLLATAILNKVVEKFQRERVDGNSNVLHDTDSPKAKYTTTESEHGLEEDSASYTSYRRECNGNRNVSIGQQNGDNREPMSFMMEERIEEVTTITSDDDEFRGNDVMEFECARRVPFPELGMDIVDPPRESSPSPSSSSDSSDFDRDEYSLARTKRHVADRAMDLISPVESWEDNWLFQKKRSSRTQPDAVAMLVPSSNADYKALIGDRDAEDTSDLSECSSTKSDEEIEKELMEAINNVVPRTPRTSECDAKNNQMENNSEVPNIRKDEIDICQVETKMEKNLCKKVYEHFDEKINENFLKSPEISEKKTIKDINDKEKLSESSFALITEAKGEDEAKEKFKDTTDCGERILAITVKNSAQKDTQSGKSNDRTGHVADENEEQRESEYTEHYDTAIQRHLDSLTKVEVCSGENELTDETSKTMNDQFRELENNSIEEQESERLQIKVQLSYATTNENHIGMTAQNDRLSAPPRPGTIAEREHKKWENAPPIENNPYSEENIRKRCLERQYSKNSDIPGAHYDLKKLNEVNLEALLALDRPDIKRFGRDYYINQSKAASGERQEQATRSTMSSMSSRPSSSLSQQSSCTGNEQREQQEESAISKEIDDISILQENKNIRATEELCRRNNAEVINLETNNRAVNSMIDTGDDQKVKSEKDAPDETAWKDHQQTDDIFEDQRKNSKNEINAKLNNQEHNLETECKNDKKRKVRRIDLKAYGFENEFMDQKKIIRQQRMVNKLDLKSFGYQDGLRRACSNNQLDQPLRNNEKSNLTRRAIERRMFEGYLIDAPKSLGYKDFAKSSKDLNKLQDKVEKMGLGLISAKSMPNVADEAYYHANPVHVNAKRDQQDELAARNLLDRAIDKSEEGIKTDERDAIIDEDDSLLNSYDELSSDVDRSFEDIYIRSKEQSRGTREKWRTMPSVKRLAEVFGRRQISETETMLAKVAKVDDIKDRSFTPEIQIIETPKPMHSLTARSLSKKFREGLRQMPGKLSSPPVSRSLIGERLTNRTEIVRPKREDNDTDVISPGKLKSNIIFWEQMQKRN
ncbi:uncharacterized protein LOC115243345 isoform X4 [Formica exsecta]|uniref:uncharacterized protein LOC115243345 isoform X4 n=1 Tax=Formica exsecta TaxID=72781 RepID=UPI001144BD8A|nr:uncharacterized protein LOC115243345 isoform X4 [Formica exsecta]